MSLLLSLLLAATPASVPSVGQRFYDEAFAARYSEPEREDWPSIVFLSRGVLLVADGEEERFSFYVRRRGDVLEFHVTNENGVHFTRSWRWLDDERAETDLFWGSMRVVSRKSPTPWERFEAFGAQLATTVLRPGSYVEGADGGVLLRVRPDGGISWPSGNGTFFVCRSDCREESGGRLCVRRGEREFMLRDAGVFVRVEVSDTCGGRSEPAPQERDAR